VTKHGTFNIVSTAMVVQHHTVQMANQDYWKLKNMDRKQS